MTGERRGVYELGPVDLSVGDLFARQAAIEERDDRARFIVRPRTVGTTGIERPDQWGGLERAKAGLTEDPSRFAGVRPYAPGDPLRRVHPRASARLGTPVTKRFEPSRDREVLIVLDVQIEHGPAWEIALRAATRSRRCSRGRARRPSARDRDAPRSGSPRRASPAPRARFAHVPISSAGGQAERVLDLLARLSIAPVGAVRAAARARPPDRPTRDDDHGR